MKFLFLAAALALLITRNPSTQGNVEQQTPDTCYLDGDPADCVTNTQQVVWDVDDHAEASGYGSIEIPLWADRGMHVWWYQYCQPRRYQPSVRVTFDAAAGPDFSLILPVNKQWTEGRFRCASGCVDGPKYDDQASLPVVPHQGGPGQALGNAVRTVVRFEALGVPERYSYFGAGADLASDQTHQRYCGASGDYLRWLTSRTCERVSDGIYSARYCWRAR